MFKLSVLCSALFLWLLFACTSKKVSFPIGYYIDDKNGKDANSGTSPDYPWKTIGRANIVKLKPGDKLMFAGGQTYPGTLFIRGVRGTSEMPVTISSYGGKRAVLDGGLHNGILIDSCEYFQIKNMAFKGSGRLKGNKGSGIQFMRVKNSVIDSVETSGFLWSGIKVVGGSTMRISNVYAHDNGFSGINVESDGRDCGGLQGSGTKSMRNLYIGYCIAENNPGCPVVKNNHSGNGILIGGVTNGLIEHCEAMNNGWDMPRGGNGPVGIWAYMCDSITIEHCYSHNNKTSPNGKDGGGFDFDGGITNSFLQYNLSLNNEGSGIGLFQYGGASRWKNNVVRYNISINDGSKNGKAGILVWSDPSAVPMTDCRVYNNTIVNNQGFGVNYEPGVYKGFVFENNIFYITVATDKFLGGNFSGSEYDNNLYWTVGSTRNYSRQPLEKLDKHGLRADPLLKIPQDLQRLLTDSQNPQYLQDFILLTGSPCVKSGKIVPSNGGKDFWGSPIPKDTKPDVGAHQVSSVE